MKNLEEGPLESLKFLSKFSEKYRKSVSASGSRIFGRYRIRDLEIAQMDIFSIKIVGIYRFRDPDQGCVGTGPMTGTEPEREQ